MKKIGEWIFCEGFLYNTNTKQLIDATLFRKKVDSDFVNTETFLKAVNKCRIFPLKKRKNHKILVLEITDKCNYACQYCFEGKSYLNKKVMDNRVAMLEVEKLSEGSEVRFFGGEPLLEFSIVKGIVEKYPYLHYSLVTNGSLMTEEMAKFMLGHDFSVGVSYDGAIWQKKNRPSLAGNSLDEFRKAMKICEKVGLKVGISTVVNKKSLADLYDIHLEVFTEYDIGGWAYLVAYSDDMDNSDLDILQEQIFSIVNDFPAQHLMRINDLKKWSMKITGEWPIDGFCGAGESYTTLTVNGEFRLCPFFVREGLCYVPEIRAFEVNCKKCYIWNYCKGGCLALNRFCTGDTHKGHPFSCRKNHIYFEAGIRTAIKRMMAERRLCKED